MTKIASSPSILRQRLKRFLYAPHNTGRLQVARISQQLSQLGPVFLFGGAIRDIALDGIRYFSSDLDFVIQCKPESLDQTMQVLSLSYPVSQNKFGGYRIQCDKWWLDIWSLENTWAFKQNHVNFESASSLLATTITNWDAILFELNSQKIICQPDYFKMLQQGILKLNLAVNPNPEGALLRVIRCLIAKPVNWLEPELFQYLKQQLSCISYQDLRQYELSQYSSCYLNQVSVELVNEQLLQSVNPNGLIQNCLNQLNFEFKYHD